MDRDEDYTAYVTARWPALVRSAALLGCSRHDAEDLVQTALVRCYRSWERVRRADDRDAYVYRVLVNCHASSRRRRWWGERPTDRQLEHAMDDPAESTLERRTMVAALHRLAADQRMVLVLRFYVDLSEWQVAQVLGLPVGTVKSRTSRALQRLALELDDTPRSPS